MAILTLKDYIGKHTEAFKSEWSKELDDNCIILLNRLNDAFFFLKINSAKINSGWRPSDYNKMIGGAKNSLHITAQACDIADGQRTLSVVLTDKVLEKCNLWIEDPAYTKSWIHFQIVPPKSKRRKFIP